MASSVVKTSARLPISMTCNAFKASMTAPGPTGIPAARNARAKPTTLSEIRPDAGPEVDVVIITLVIPRRAQREPEIWRLSREPTRFEIPGSRQSSVPRNDEESILARGFLQNLLQRVALHPSDVVLIFQQRPKRVADHLRGQRAGIEFGQRGGPVDGFGTPRRFVENLLTQRLHEADDLPRQFCGNSGHTRFDDREFAL